MFRCLGCLRAAGTGRKGIAQHWSLDARGSAGLEFHSYAAAMRPAAGLEGRYMVTAGHQTRCCGSCWDGKQHRQLASVLDRAPCENDM